MDWTSFLGHHRQRTWFSNAIEHNRLASTFLFVGPDGIGKRSFARLIAKTLLCNVNPPHQFDPCGKCEACIQIEADTHPDLILISKRPDKAALSIDQLVGENEMRMREGMCYELRMRPYSGKRKIAIVDDADTLAVDGANSLLKTLEEPPPGAMIFLIGTSEQRQLPTIRSRCQIVRFAPLSNEDVVKLVLRHGLADSAEEASRLASLSKGSMSLISQAKDEAFAEFRAEFLRQLCERPIHFPRLAKSVLTHVDSATQDSHARRDLLKQLIDAVIGLHRDMMFQSTGASVASTAEPDSPSQPLGGIPMHMTTLSGDQFGDLIRRSMQAREQIDRMVTQASVVESWLAEIASLSRA